MDHYSKRSRNKVTSSQQRTKNVQADALFSSNGSKSINFDKPLMTCIETLQHNKCHYVRKPAGILNSIAVPLMAYSSSLEQGTIFAADQPKNIDFSKLPKFNTVITDTPANIKITRRLKTPKKLKDMPSSFLTSKNLKVMPASGMTSKKLKVMPGSGMTSERSALVTETKQRGEFVIPDSSIRAVRSKRISNADCPSTSLLDKPVLNRKAIIHQYEAKKFKNKKKADNNAMHSIPKLQSINEEITDEAVISLDEEETMSDDDRNVPCVRAYGGYINTNLIFVPYTAHPVNVTPESLDAHTGGDIHDYGLPLMNCVATIFQDKNKLSNLLPDEEMTIDVPLLTCLKTLENANLGNY